MATRPFIAAVFAALALVPLRDAAASHSPPISGTGTAAVDGVLSPGEWDGAATIDFTAALPAVEGGGPVPARAFVMNDASNLYLALRLARDTYGFGAEVNWFFDRANNGFRQDGDDTLYAQVWRTSGLIFYDGYRWRCQGAPAGTFAHCGAAHDWHQVEGAPPPGTTDGQAAVQEGNGAVVFEIAHPLDSADDAHDFSVAPGSLLGYHVSARFRASCSEPGCWADASPPDGHIGISPGAELQAAGRAAPTRVRVGKSFVYTLSVRAAESGSAARDVSLEAELPSTVRVTSVRTTLGSCSGRQFFDCKLGTIAPGSAAVVMVRALAVRPGRARLSARLATTSYETSASSHAATATATVVRR